MAYLFNLVFLLLKIVVQSYAYAFLVRKLAKLYAIHYPNSWLARAGQQPSFRRRSQLLLAAALFGYSCTYWGDHGLGDYARIPLGNDEVIEEIDIAARFEATVPYEHPADQLFVDSYQIAKETLCAKAPDDFYFAYDLVTKRCLTFISAKEYDSYASRRGLPVASRFQSFSEHYRQYWGGWRFWLLA